MFLFPDLKEKYMDDTVLIGKTGTIERCCRRAREEYEKDPTTFVGDLTRQDAATLNVIRAWEAAVEMGDYVIAMADLGEPFTTSAKSSPCWPTTAGSTPRWPKT
jgi:hypothetical protein